ncbi:50S ribosomal protein L2 [Candidatus Pacearchaeota archaeon]|nr:50S ribosomal protein L2 [Candidatus Pacearchaeota archaeon]
MAKRIISQARGHGSGTYRVRRAAFKYRLQYPPKLQGEGTVVSLLSSAGHTAPIAKIRYNEGIFFIPAFKGMVEGQTINLDSKEVKEGNIIKLESVPIKTNIYSIEASPGDGGIFIKTGGSSAYVNRTLGEKVYVMMPSKQEKEFNKNCRAIIGVIAGEGRLDKPFMKAGTKHHLMLARGKLYPRTSAIKVNVIDHPFGSGRGKNPKRKTAKRDAPPGKRVGHIRPSRTGRKKR